MELTPNDVEQKAFTQALRGYQMDEVDDFLDEIVTTLRAYDQRLRDAQEKIRALESDAISRSGDETTISRAILVAQRSADALLAEARLDADRIRHTAVAETQSLSAERDNERNRLQADIDGMRERVSGLRETLAALASAVGGQVGEMEARIAGVEADLQPGAAEVAATTDDRPPDLFFVPADHRSARFDGDDLEISADVEGSGPLEEPESIDLSKSDDEDDFGGEEVVSRVSARPWERG